ncbi:MAG: amidohydrolase family protein [Candidatus Eisenbacteria bacterium]
MRPVVLSGGTVLTLDASNRVLHPGAVRVEGDRITDVGPADDVPTAGAERIDARGTVLLPGLFNAHTHLYSTLARGLAPLGPAPSSFREILERLWWRWDRLLDDEAVARNAEAGLIESVRRGVTAVNDHHSGPNAIASSLDRIAEAALAIGVRVALGYEVSDRDGAEARDAGLEENRRFALRAADEAHPLLTATIGAHASFTLSEETLGQLASLMAEVGRPVHIHVDEGPEDAEDARARGHRSTVARLARAGIVREGTLVVHAVHADAEDIDILARAGVFVVHNPRSNGANAVGRAPLGAFLRSGVRLAVGTDGMSGDPAADAAVAGAVHRMAERDRSIPFDLPFRLAWEGNVWLAGSLFGKRMGALAPGYAGDVVAYRYDPPAPIRPESVAAHWQLGIASLPAEHVVVGGEPVLVDRRFLKIDEEEVLERARECAERLRKAFHS